jgi:hypothetical protein
MLLAALYFPVSGGRPALSVPSPAVVSHFLTSLVTTPGPLVGQARPTFNYLFPIPTYYGPSTKLHCYTREERV